MNRRYCTSCASTISPVASSRGLGWRAAWRFHRVLFDRARQLLKLRNGRKIANGTLNRQETTQQHCNASNVTEPSTLLHRSAGITRLNEASVLARESRRLSVGDSHQISSGAGPCGFLDLARCGRTALLALPPSSLALLTTQTLSARAGRALPLSSPSHLLTTFTVVSSRPCGQVSRSFTHHDPVVVALLLSASIASFSLFDLPASAVSEVARENCVCCILYCFLSAPPRIPTPTGHAGRPFSDDYASIIIYNFCQSHSRLPAQPEPSRSAERKRLHHHQDECSSLPRAAFQHL